MEQPTSFGLNSDGTPTDLYKKYRKSGSSKAAIAQAIKTGYREAFERNEYAYNLSKEQFKRTVQRIDCRNHRL
jgi:Family of unknown function (DUF5343)